MVEHDLAKVGVASSSLVSRSVHNPSPEGEGFCFKERKSARVVKLVDTSRFSIGMARMVVRVEFLK